MVLHAINKETFEFTCSSEAIAKSVQQEFELYIVPQINAIINDILSQYTGEDARMVIDTIEIDLGKISLKDIDKKESLERFEHIFEEKMRIFQAGHDEHHQALQSDYRDGNHNPGSSAEIELEMISRFMLQGDLPWWADKSKSIDPDTLFQQLAQKDSRRLKDLLERHRADPPVLLRLATQSKPSTRKLIDEPIPGIIPAFLRNSLFGKAVGQIALPSLSKEQLDRLFSILAETRPTVAGENLEAFLNKLVKTGDTAWMENPALVQGLTAEERVTLQTFVRAGKKAGRALTRKAISSLQKLSPFQLAFLSYYIFQAPPPLGSGPDKQVLQEPAEQEGPQDGGTGLADSRIGESVTRAVHAAREPAPGSDADSFASAVRHAKERLPLQASDDTQGSGDWETLQNGEPESTGKYETFQPKAVDASAGPGAETKTAAGDSYPASGNKAADVAVDAIAALQDQPVSLMTGNMAPLPSMVRDEDHEPLSQPPITDPVTITDAGQPPFSESPAEENAIDERGEAISPYGEEAGQPTSLTVGGQVTGAQTGTVVTGPVSHKNMSRPATAEKGSDTTMPGKAGHLSREETPNQSGTRKPLINDPVITRKIGFIMKRLNEGNAAMFHYLQQLEKSELDRLHAIFKMNFQEVLSHKKMVSRLLDHPYFLSYNLLNLYANLSFHDPAGRVAGLLTAGDNRSNKRMALLEAVVKKIQFAQTGFVAMADTLSFNETLVIRDILQKQQFDTRDERSVMRKLLNRVPAESIRVLDFLTGLSEEEIRPLVASVQNTLPGGNNDVITFKGITAEEPPKIYIENAGLCLVALYLPGLFGNLGYLENRIFKNKAYAMRALYVIQYLATGNPRPPEFLLQLNKLLTGFELGDAIAGSVRLTKKETAETDSMIESVITNWKALRNTSVEGFRTSFLQRKGILFEKAACWTLQVERKGHDVLLNNIPWGFSMIKLPWMKKMIQVEW